MKKLSLSTQLALMAGVGVATAAATAVIGYRGLKQAEQSLDASNRGSAALYYQTNIDMMHDGLRADALSALVAKDDATEQIVRASTDEHAAFMKAMLGKLDALELNPELRTLLSGAREDIEAYTVTAQTFVATATADRTRGLSGLPAFEGVFEALEAQLGALGEEVQRASEASVSAAVEAAATAKYTLLSSAVVSITLLGLSSWRLAAAIRRRVRHLKGAIDQVAKKDLTVEVVDDCGDDFGAMAVALTSSVTSTRTAMHAIQNSATSLGAASKQLAGVSQQLGRVSVDTSAEVKSIASSSSTVAQNVRSVSDATGAMSASISEIATTTSRAVSIVERASALAVKTRSTVKQLGDSSHAISSVVNIIATIAEQTKMLSLNATIEAARAGDMGQGFAVVATEVKQLASTTAKATADIQERIAAMESDTAASIDEIERIANVINEISALQTTIAAAVQQQAATTSEINRALALAAEGSSSIDASMAKVTHGADSAALGAQDTESAAKDLLGLASQLSGLVAQFHLRATA